MPFIDHHGGQCTELFAGRLVGQHQTQAFRRGDQRLGKGSCLVRALGRTGVTGSQADIPVQSERARRFAQGECGVGREGAHRGDPQYPQTADGRFACGAPQCA